MIVARTRSTRQRRGKDDDRGLGRGPRGREREEQDDDRGLGRGPRGREREEQDDWNGNVNIIAGVKSDGFQEQTNFVPKHFDPLMQGKNMMEQKGEMPSHSTFQYSQAENTIVAAIDQQQAQSIAENIKEQETSDNEDESSGNENQQSGNTEI